MDTNRINSKMHELANHLGITFNDINRLAMAMDSTPLPKSPGDGKHKDPDCKNTALATVGDAILKTVLSDYIFSQDIENARKGNITKRKEALENNTVLFAVMSAFNLKQFTYNQHYFYNDPIDSSKAHLKVGDSKHNQYIEAIIAAIYYDLGFNAAKKWILERLLPQLEKCAACQYLPLCETYRNCIENMKS